MWKPTVMLCGPGGAKSFLTIGALKRLFEEEDFMNDVKIWVGVSAGAAISLLTVIGYTTSEIGEICMNVSLIDDVISINLDEAQKRMGLIKNKTVEEKLISSVKNKCGFIPTLKQLYSLTGCKLSLVSFNLDKMRPEFLDKDTEPDLSCIEAAMMSMAVPLLVQPRKYKGNIYLDGAIGAPYPTLDFDHSGNKILGLYISSEQDLYCPDKKPTSYMYKLIQAGMKVLRDNEIRFASENVKHIPLKTEIRDTTGLSISKEDRQSMIDQGYQCADSFLKINENPEKYKIEIPEDEEIPFT